MNPITKLIKNYINMSLKKALPLLFVCTILLVGITGCTTQETTSNVGNASSGGGSGSSQAISVTATQTTVPSFQSYTPKAGMKYVAYDATVKNINAKSRYIGPSNFQLRNASGGVYTVAMPTYASDNPKELKGINSQPGDVDNGIIIFEVPQNVQLTSLTYDDGTSKVTLNI